MATLTIADLDNGQRDLQTVDAVANSPNDTTITRYGDSVLTLAGVLRRLGYKAPVPYASGLAVDSALFTVSRDGVIYAPDPAMVPFTTGAWNAAQWRPVQNTANTNQIYQFPTLGAAQLAAPTLPTGSAVVVDGVSQGHAEGGAYVPEAGVPAIVFQDYTAMIAYTGKASLFQIKKPGISGLFEVIPGDTTSAANGGTMFVLADGRRVRRIYQAGSVYFDWWGADNTGNTDCAELLEQVHKYAFESTIDRKILFSGKYLLSRKVKIRGIAQWQGILGGAGGTQFMWGGTDDAAISLDPQDWFGNYQMVFQDIGVTRLPTASRAAAFEHIRTSECEFTNVYAKDMACLHRLRGATIMYFNRNTTADCDNVIELHEGAGLFFNSMLFFKHCNFWETAGSIFQAVSGLTDGIYFDQGFLERFGQVIGNGPNTGTAHVTTDVNFSNTQMWASDRPNTRLIYFKSKPGTVASGLTNVTFSRVRADLDSSDNACRLELNGNTSVGSALGSGMVFEDCHIYGAVTALVSSDSTSATVRLSGRTLAQQGYYSGDLLIPAHDKARLIESNRVISYQPTFSSDNATASIGNGMTGGGYVVQSGRVDTTVSVNFGSTTVAGTGVWEFSLPFPGLGQVTGTAFVTTPGVGSAAAIVIGDASTGKFRIIQAANAIGLPVGFTTNASTTISIQASYQNLNY